MLICRGRRAGVLAGKWKGRYLFPKRNGMRLFFVLARQHLDTKGTLNSCRRMHRWRAYKISSLRKRERASCLACSSYIKIPIFMWCIYSIPTGALYPLMDEPTSPCMPNSSSTSPRLVYSSGTSFLYAERCTHIERSVNGKVWQSRRILCFFVRWAA